MVYRLFLVLSTSVLIMTGSVLAEEPGPTCGARLDLDCLFSGTDFDAEHPPKTEWLDGGDRYTTLEPSSSLSDASDLVAYESVSGKRTVLVAAEKLVSPDSGEPFEIEGYEWSSDGAGLLLFTDAERVWRDNTRGDYWLLDMASSKLTRVGAGAEAGSLMFAKLSPDGRSVAYVRDNDLYVEEIGAATATRLTTDGSPTSINGTFDWVYEEELSLQDGFRWSPDGRRIAFWHMDSSVVQDFKLINTTDTLYPEITRIPYPKVGQRNSSATIAVIEVASGETTWLQLPGDPSDGYVARMMWAQSDDEILIQKLNRRQNTNTVFLCESSGGECRTVLVERDEAWVELHADPTFVRDGDYFTWLSERDGWQHLYLVNRDGGEIRLLTPGAYDVTRFIAVDEAAGWAYFMASPSDPLRRYLHRVPLDGSGELQRLTPAEQLGSHAYDVAPNGTVAFHSWSGQMRPSSTALITLPEHGTVRHLVDNAELRERVEALDAVAPEFFKVDIGEGVELDGWVIKPPDFDPSSKYPVLFFVYGEPAGQTTVDRWARKRGLWHVMLSQQGYVVMSVDNRGTPAPLGRAWRKVVYRQIGILASSEQAAAASALSARWPWIDTDRIGIWGWSGGGSMTLNMLFRHPEIYSVGMSVAPVADQRLYDTIYQERYMGLLEDNEEGYIEGSPITHAHRLEGELLLVHGTADDNVHYQNSERLVNELIEHNKFFTVMPYPNRTHSIRQGENTTRHLYGLMTRFLNEKLPPGPRASEDASREPQEIRKR